MNTTMEFQVGSATATPQPHDISEPFVSLHTRIIEFLKTLPNLTNENGQRAFIYAMGLDPALQEQIHFSLSLSEFVPFLVETLRTYGKLQDGRYALRAVLETAKQYVGRDRQAVCEKLIQELSNDINSEYLDNRSIRSQTLTKTLSEEQSVLTPTHDKKQGGISGLRFGNIGGNVTIQQAEGDLVGRDKITTTQHIPATPAMLTYGFKQAADKTEFLQQIEEVRTLLRELKSAVEALNDLHPDQKDELAMDVMQQVKDLKTVKDIAETIVIGQEASQEQVNLVKKSLDKTATLLMQPLKNIGGRATGAEKIGSAATNALSLLAHVRRLLGLS